MNRYFWVLDKTGVFGNVSGKKACLATALGICVLTAGCSADVARFDQPSFGLTGSGATGDVRKPTQPLTRRTQPSRYDQSSNSYSAGQAYQPPRQPARSGVRTAALPDISTTQRPTAAPYQPPRAEPVVLAPAPAARVIAPRVRTQTSTGSRIQVQRGDTLYGLSRRHGVSLKELMAANGLTGPNLRPGQMLTLPSGVTASPQPARTRTALATRAPAASAPKNWNGSYTVARGDSLYVIARKHGVKTTDLQRYNGIKDPRKVRPGTVLRIPGADGSTLAQAAPVVEKTKREPKPDLRVGGTRVAMLNSKTTTTDAAPPRVVQSVQVTPPKIKAPDNTKLRWPVRGKIISRFGRRPDGTHNDGVNLEVPLGSDIHAAEAGVVAYAGSELKGYGKLILLRHDNGWVTAYAHNQSVLVKRGDKIKRGQVIAKAGKTGQVDRPQVHFELRRDAKPVDPVPYLETL